METEAYNFKAPDDFRYRHTGVAGCNLIGIHDKYSGRMDGVLWIPGNHSLEWFIQEPEWVKQALILKYNGYIFKNENTVVKFCKRIKRMYFHKKLKLMVIPRELLTIILRAKPEISACNYGCKLQFAYKDLINTKNMFDMDDDGITRHMRETHSFLAYDTMKPSVLTLWHFNKKETT